jgi:hypothetical protein
MYTYTIEHATYNTYPACKDLACTDAPPEDNVPLFPTFPTLSRNDDSASRGCMTFSAPAIRKGAQNQPGWLENSS